MWVLNRMEHWLTLLQAYLMKVEANYDGYAEKVSAELLNWIDQCPRPAISGNMAEMRRNFDSPTPWRSLEAGIRMFKTWPAVIAYLVSSGNHFTPELLERLAISVYEHTEVLRSVSPRFYPNADHNHYLMEMLGLYAAMVQFPEFKVGAVWKDFAKGELVRCVEKQITEGGGQIEGCPHYHNETLYYFYLAQMIAVSDADSFPNNYMARLGNAINYTIHTLRPTGLNVPWGDSDASMFPVRTGVYEYYATNHLRCLNALKTLLGKSGTMQEALSYIWDTRNINDFIGKLEQDPAGIDLEPCNYQKQLKQVMFRTDWTGNASSVFFACRTPVYNTHQHIDPMGFDFTALGKVLFVDPGRYTYSEQALRKFFKSAASHNTITVDNKEPWNYISSWEYGPQKNGDIIYFNNNKAIYIVEARQDNFDPYIHNRLLALIDSKILLVLDRVAKLGINSTVQLYYHRDTVDLGIGENNTIIDNSPDVRAAIAFTQGLRVSLLSGYVSELMDHKHNSQIIRLDDNRQLAPYRFYGTVIVPYQAGSTKPDIEILLQEAGEDLAIVGLAVNGNRYRYHWMPGERLVPRLD
jgi:hypothetical protein